MRLLSRLFCLFVLAVGTQLTALPLGNPAEPTLLYRGAVLDCLWEPGCNNSWFGQYHFRLGYCGDYVYDRKMRVDKNFRSARIHQTKICTNAAYLALNFCDWIDLFGTLGATNIRIDTYQTAWLTQPGNADFSYLLSDTGFSWSLGLRGTLWQWRCFSLGAEVQYFRAIPKLNNFRLEGLPPTYFDTTMHYQEWQVGGAISYKIPVISNLSSFVPYIGIKGSWAKLSTGNAMTPVAAGGDRFFDIFSDINLGYAVGCSFVGSACWSITGEARFVDERAFDLTLQFAF